MLRDIENKTKETPDEGFKLPDKVEEPGILVGWSLEDQNKPTPIGFTYNNPKKPSSSGYLDPILMQREGHLITIAPTGAGKGIGCIIPTLLRYTGPVIVIDPKGENSAVTARRRKELGQKVVILDPMCITDIETDRLNPLDLIDPDSPLAVDDVAALVNELWSGKKSDPGDRFWMSRASELVTCAILHILSDRPKEQHTFIEVRLLINEWLSNLGNEDKKASNFRKLSNSRNPEVVRIASGLLNPANETLGGILSFCQDSLAIFRGPLVGNATKDTTFDLDGITRGDNISIYIVLPPHMLESHGSLMKLWVSTLMRCITRRRGSVKQDTLFILDEAAQLGVFPQLRQAITLLRGYGVKTWSFWQDASQLKRLYPDDWETMVNNCCVFQAFGANNYPAAQQVAGATGFNNASKILDLEFDEMILLIAGDEAVIAQRPNYLTDPTFKGLYDDNPLRNAISDSFPERKFPKQFYTRPRSKMLSQMKQEDNHLLKELLGLWDQEK